MLKSKVLIEKVNARYFELKTQHQSVNHYNEQILLSNENYVNFSNQLGKLKFSLAKAEYLGDNTTANSLKTQVETLEKLIETLKSTLPLTKIEYNCDICKDTGVIDGKRCKCFYRYVTEFMLESLGICEVEETEFSSIMVDKNLTKQYKVIKNYADNFPNTQIPNLILSGNVGTGKTTFAKCVYTTVKKSDNVCVFLSATELNGIFLKVHTSIADRNVNFDLLTEADLLIIDDLGTENIYKNVTVEYLLSLISTRLERNKPFIITTNLTTKELLDRYNERFLSRLSDPKKTLFIPFKTEDLRRIK